MQLELKILDPRVGGLEYATEQSAAVDLRACAIDGRFLSDTKDETIPPGARAKISTGVAIDLGSDVVNTGLVAAMILPRSGLGARGIVLSNLVGLIDPDYQGEITLALWNTSQEAFLLKPLDRLAQMLIVPIVNPGFRVVDEFSRITERGAGGFGSTGVA